MKDKIFSILRELKRKNFFSVPLEYEEDFFRQLYYLNLSRIKFFTKIISLLMVILIYMDFSNSADIGHRSLMYSHLIFLIGLLLIALINWRIWPNSADEVKKAHIIISHVFTIFSLFMCVALSVFCPVNMLSVYIIGCLGIASMVSLRPYNSFIIYAVVHITFIDAFINMRNNDPHMYYLLMDGTLAVIIGWVLSVINFKTRVSDYINKKTIEVLSCQDSLTGVANRRQFDRVIEIEWLRCLREKSPLSLIILDIDHFKNYNDAYGHLAGDICLKKITTALVEIIRRPSDLIARYGGEEFAIILPNTDETGAVKLAERLRAEIEKLNIPHKHSNVDRKVTISLGVSTVIPQLNSDVDNLIIKADQALYKAKEKGRNQVWVIS